MIEFNRSKIDDLPPPYPPFFDISRSLSSRLLSLCPSVFCLSVSISMLHLSKVPIDGAHVTDICCISFKCICLFDLLWCIYLMFERQIYLMLVGVFVAIHFQISINDVIHIYQSSLSAWTFRLSVFPSFCLSVFFSVFLYFHFVISLS